MPNIELLDRLFFQFVLFSISGWVLEALYRSIRYGRPVNPGFFSGPWLPLYGTAAVALSLLFSLIEGHSIYARAAFYLIFTTGLELITGEFLLRLFKQRFWDYTENFRNFRGHICPSFSLIWVACCFAYELVLHPFSLYVTSLVPLHALQAANVSFFILITADFMNASQLLPWGGLLGARLKLATDVIEERLQNSYESLYHSDIARQLPVLLKKKMPRPEDAREQIAWYRERLKEITRASRW